MGLGRRGWGLMGRWLSLNATGFWFGVEGFLGSVRFDVSFALSSFEMEGVGWIV